MRFAVIGLLPQDLRDLALERGPAALPLRVRLELCAREAAAGVGGGALGVLARLGPAGVPLLVLLRAAAVLLDLFAAALDAAAALLGLSPAVD